MAEGPHLSLLLEAITIEGRGHRALLDGDEVTARANLKDASQRYRESWEVAPPASYARAIVALVQGHDADARSAAAGMRSGSPAFGRPADAITALADRDADAYADAVAAIVADFEGREQHLTGVPIADTGLMLERFANARGMASRPVSALLPVG